jgi:hypothetical protein
LYPLSYYSYDSAVDRSEPNLLTVHETPADPAGTPVMPEVTTAEMTCVIHVLNHVTSVSYLYTSMPSHTNFHNYGFGPVLMPE